MMKTFEEFQKSGRNVHFTDEQFKHLGVSAEYGRLYDGDCVIELMDDGRWLLILANEEYVGDLFTLEKRLYSDWYIRENADTRYIQTSGKIDILRVSLVETPVQGNRKIVGGVRTIELKNGEHRRLMMMTWDEANHLATLITKYSASDLVKLAVILREVTETAERG